MHTRSLILRYNSLLLLFIITRYIYSVLLLTLLLLHFPLVLFIITMHYYYSINARACTHTHTHTHTHTRNTHTRAHALSTSLLHASCMMSCTCASLLHALYISLSLSCLVHDKARLRVHKHAVCTRLRVHKHAVCTYTQSVHAQTCIR
jgi:hypothetical protein